MGNFEKLVVLTVLFLSAIVLAVSLSSDDEDGGETPFLAAERMSAERAGLDGEADNARLAMTAEGARRGAAPAGETTRGPGRAERGDAAGAGRDGATPKTAPKNTAEPAAPATNAQGHPLVLRDKTGLTASLLDDYMVYTPAEDETWSLLAARFYGSANYVPLLRSANEDLTRPSVGEPILVPVFDFRATPQDHKPRTAAPARAPQTQDGQGAAPSGKVAGTTYEVVDGDNLWKVASKVYGSGARWMELYEANKDVLADPDALTIGMKLRIPR